MEDATRVYQNLDLQQNQVDADIDKSLADEDNRKNSIKERKQQ